MFTKAKTVFRFFPAILISLLFFSLLPISPVSATTGFTLSKYSGSPGDTITISGTFDTVSTGAAAITFNNIYMGLATISSGSFTDTFQVPVLPRGKYTVSITVEGSSVSLSEEFTVIPMIAINDSTVCVGDQIIITGNGFSTGTVYLYIDNSATPFITTTANESGILNPLTITVPSANKAVHILKAVDNAGTANSVYTTFNVIPKITLSDNTSGAGAQVTVTGTGFASSSMITITLNSITMSTSLILTDNTGSFIATFSLPITLSKGNCSILASDSSGNVATASLLIKQSISLSSDSGSAGDTVTINGASFDPNKAVSIYFNNVILSNTQTDAYGAFSLDISIPSITQGSYIIKAVDANNNEATEHFAVEPYITITSDSNKVGANVNINGYGFAVLSDITIFFDNESISTIKTNSNGAFTVEVAIPHSICGEHTIKVVDQEDNQKSIIFTTIPDISLDYNSGFYGDIVTISGTGFASGSSVLNRAAFTIDNTALAINEENVYTDEAGNFTASFTIPDIAGGTHVIRAVDTYNNTASFSLGVEPSITLNLTTGIAGDEVQITGHGFASNKKINITYNNGSITTTPANVMTSGTGTFNTSFIIPDIAAGTYKIEAGDGINTAAADFIETIETAPPAAVSLISPVDNNKASQPVVFNWSASSDPSGVFYKLQVGTDATFSTIKLDIGNLTATSYKMDSETKLESVNSKNPYYWRVMAIDGVGNESGWTTDTFIVSSGWPVWLIVICGILGFAILVLLGLWIGRKMATIRNDSAYNYNIDADIENQYREQYPDNTLSGNKCLNNE
jgi:hypothetical protein